MKRAAWEVIDAPEVGEMPERASPLAVSAADSAVLRAPADYAADFVRARVFAFSNFLAADFAAKIAAICDRAQFVPDGKPDQEHRTREEPRLAGTAISLALQRPAVLRWFEAATNCGPLVSAYGSVLRVPADGRSNLWWHDDLGTDPARRLGITLYLGGAPYEGGLFELREKTGTLLARHRHTHFASALIFDVAPGLEHRLSPVTAGGPRQVFTGWLTRAV